MYSHETQIRVRYADTDQMGFVYYGNYATFYEVGRVEMLRSLGMTYSSMEEAGIIMPVTELNSKFIKPALYDDVITIKTIMEKLPSVRIYFRYELSNEKGELINLGETTLVFLSNDNRRPCQPPEQLITALAPHFE